MKKSKSQTRKQTTARFWLILVIGGIIGGILGASSQFLAGSGKLSFGNLQHSLIILAPYLVILLNVFFLLWALLFRIQSKRMIAEWKAEEDNEELYDQLSRKEEIGLMFTSIDVILNMILFGITMAGISSVKGHIALFMTATLAFMVGVIGITFVQRMIIDQMKQVSPEKQGDALDVHFRKKWIDSCDEQERQQIYKASYKAFSINNMVYPFVWVVLVTGQMVWNIGLLPIILVGLMWLLQTVVYQLECIKEKK